MAGAKPSRIAMPLPALVAGAARRLGPVSGPAEASSRAARLFADSFRDVADRFVPAGDLPIALPGPAPCAAAAARSTVAAGAERPRFH